MKTLNDLTGKTFGSWKVIKRAKNRSKSDHHAYWLCKCECGRISTVRGSALVTGQSISCGCSRGTHNMTNTRLFNIWQNIRGRTKNPNNQDYKDYGGRGIKICPEWDNDFMNFYNWAIENDYSDNLSIDRIDVNGNYEPSNCRWATPIQQGRNKRNNLLITYKNETHCLSEWEEILGIDRRTLSNRFKRGVDLCKP